MIKTIVNWTIFAASALYGLWAFGKLFSVLFNLGENETAFETLTLLAFGLAPFPTSFLALKWRKLSALIFAGTALLFVLAVKAIVPVVPLLVFAIFYVITDLARWPKISLRTPMSCTS